MGVARQVPRMVVGWMARGLFILLPVFVIGLAVARILEMVHAAVQPALDACPQVFFHVPAARVTVGILAMLALFGAVGLLAQMRLGRAIGRRVEEVVLNRVPFYQILRRLASGLAGEDRDDSLRPVMVEVNPGIRQFGFVMDRHGSGSCTVFLPSSPNTGSGTVLVVDAALVTDVAAPGHKVLRCLHQWGGGSCSLQDK